MKILYIIPGLEQGGAEMHVINLANEMQKLGHEILIATTGGKLENLLNPNIKIIHAQVERKNFITGIYAAFKLSRLNPDIIHAHSRVPAWIAYFAKKFNPRLKWLMTAHAMYSLNFGIWPFKKANGVICVSDAVKNYLAGRIPENSITIYNGIKITGEQNIPPCKNKFLFVGRLTRLKNVDVVIKAFANLKNYEWQFEIIGDGSQMDTLKNLTNELNLQDRIKFLGALDNNSVIQNMLRSDCLIFPSSSEGMGLAVLEALSVNLPVIASDINALREISTGNLIQVGDVEAWKNALENFMLNKISSTFKNNCVISISEMAKQTEAFYNSIR